MTRCAVSGCQKPATKKISITDRIPVGLGYCMTVPRCAEVCEDHGDPSLLVSINAELRVAKAVA